ncbi:MAG: hypothetical protein JO135_00665 [Candidatus Eremiobacteraeota bacterium]|nr:hypothetical protein [Candidatus Eremiobacteraeota bacterium]
MRSAYALAFCGEILAGFAVRFGAGLGVGGTLIGRGGCGFADARGTAPEPGLAAALGPGLGALPRCAEGLAIPDGAGRGTPGVRCGAGLAATRAAADAAAAGVAADVAGVGARVGTAVAATTGDFNGTGDAVARGTSVARAVGATDGAAVG